jgi:hypothetical protein
MTGRIIPLHGDLHEQANALLPWYVTNRLDADERQRVAAHISGCAQCQADLAAESRLQALIKEAPEPIGDIDAAWAKFEMRPMPQPRAEKPLVRQWRQSPGWMRWAVAAQLALLVLGGAAWVLRTETSAPAYHVLGAAPKAVQANVVVIFRPDTRESDLRAVLRDNRARLVDGPTAADAYLLHIEPTVRTEALQRMRATHSVVLAEPVDAVDAAGAER